MLLQVTISQVTKWMNNSKFVQTTLHRALLPLRYTSFLLRCEQLN